MKIAYLFLTLVLVSLIALVAVQGWKVYTLNDTQKDVTLDGNESQKKVPDEIKGVFGQLQDVRQEGRREGLEQGLKLLEEEYVQAQRDGADHEKLSWIQVAIGDVSLPLDTKKGYDILITIYNDEALPTGLRGTALTAAMLYGAKVGSQKLSFEDAKQWIFAPDKLGYLFGVDAAAYSKITTVEDIQGLVAQGFRLGVTMVDSRIQQIHFEIEALALESDIELSTLYKKSPETYSHEHLIDIYAQDTEMQDAVGTSRVTKLRDEIKDRLDQNRTGDEFQGDYIEALAFIQRLYSNLFFASKRNRAYEDILDTRQILKRYIALHGNESESTKLYSNLITAWSDLRLSCVIAIRSDYNVSESEKIEIRDLLESLYNLTPEQKINHTPGLADIATKPYESCYEAIVYIGNSVDPRLKDFFIQDVGTWSESQFK